MSAVMTTLQQLKALGATSDLFLLVERAESVLVLFEGRSFDALFAGPNWSAMLMLGARAEAGNMLAGADLQSVILDYVRATLDMMEVEEALDINAEAEAFAFARSIEL